MIYFEAVGWVKSSLTPILMKFTLLFPQRFIYLQLNIPVLFSPTLIPMSSLVQKLHKSVTEFLVRSIYRKRYPLLLKRVVMHLQTLHQFLFSFTLSIPAIPTCCNMLFQTVGLFSQLQCCYHQWEIILIIHYINPLTVEILIYIILTL